MRVTFIDVGYGDAVLFQSGNYTMLLDGGGDLPEEFAGDAFRIRAVDYLKRHGITHIDAVMISHIHEDHVCGLEPILAEIPADCFYTPYPVDPFLKAVEIIPGQDAPRSVPLYSNALNAYGRIIRNAVAAGKPVSAICPGEVLTLSDDLTVRVLAPKPQNIDTYMTMVNRVLDEGTPEQEVTELLSRLDATSNGTSLLLRVEIENIAFLMAADCCPREWGEVPSSLLENVNVLKLPHHGQVDSVNEALMAPMGLSYVVTTASSDRRYNSANAEVYRKFCAMYEGKTSPKFLFTDEREYSPYFRHPEGFHAIVMTYENGNLTYKTAF